jgi:hypothetical protein
MMTSAAEFNHSEEVAASWMDQAMKVKDVVAALLAKEIQALCEDPEHHAVLDGLPATDARGLVPAGTLCGRTNLNYTGSSTRVHSRGLQRASNGIIPWPVG